MTQPNSAQDIVLLDNISLTNLGAYMLFEEIHEESALHLCEYLLKANIICAPDDTLTLFINSGGGSVTDGWAIIDVMETSRLNLSTVALGCIASMAVLIFVAGTKGLRVMTPKTAVMTHQFSTAFWGKSHELMAARKFHDTLEKQFIEHFVRHTKMTEKQVREVLLKPSDTWLTAEECLAYGICDVIRNPFEAEEEPAPKKKKAPAKAPAKKKKPAVTL
jgi:ATP-dependent Clp protease protease subunit